jgi:hypothetical protein
VLGVIGLLITNEVSDNLKQFLSSEFTSLKSNANFTHALPGHLNYTTELENCRKIVLSCMQSVIDIGSTCEFK